MKLEAAVATTFFGPLFPGTGGVSPTKDLISDLSRQATPLRGAVEGGGAGAGAGAGAGVHPWDT